MATETMEEFLARGGSIEKSSEKQTLAELLESTKILNKEEAEKVTKDLNKTLDTNLNKELN